ncbi:MAG: prepilin-type N-terminal cleavage/methylation domain-containing protein [Candidatus Omnitrophota bacterium]
MRTIYPTGSKGFTLLEILITISVFTFGFSQIFSIFFESGAAVQHVENRLAAVVLMENATWEAVDFRGPLDAVGTYRRGSMETAGGQEFHITAEASKVPGFRKLHRLDVTAVWNEGKKNVSMKKESFIRKQ